MPSTSKPQKRLMAAAAHTPGGFGGVPQKVGKEFNDADTQKKEARKFNKGGSVSAPSSKEQAYENNKAEALAYPGPTQELEKGGKVDKQHTTSAHGGWKRWGQR